MQNYWLKYLLIVKERGITSDHQNFQAFTSLLKIYHTDHPCLPQTK